MDHRTVFVLVVTGIQVGVIFGQAPSLKTEHQCGALYDRKLFHMCSAGASLRSARATPRVDPLTDAVMHKAQSLLDRATFLIGRSPGKTDPPRQDATKKETIDANSALVDQLKHAAQTLTVSSCIIQNSVDVINDAIRAMEGGSVTSQEAPVADGVRAKPVTDPPVTPIEANGKPLLVKPSVEGPELSNSGPSYPEPLPGGVVMNDTDKLDFLNNKVQTLTTEVAEMLQKLGSALTTPHRSQEFVRLVRAPLQEIQQIQLVLTRSEGAELEDVLEAENIVRDLQTQQAHFQRYLDVPEELTEKLKQPKDRNKTQTLVKELRALKQTVAKIVPLPQLYY